ncbi:MAG: molecular chaperone DjiA [Pseudomonadota bacterium]
MSIWRDLQNLVEDARERTFGAVMNAVAERRAQRKEEAFSVALIALSAKLAKADGVVTDDEIDAFRDFFAFDEEDANRVRMIYSLAQQDVAGFEHYLGQVARLFEGDDATLEDVLDCLFHIAAADGVAHPAELAMLEKAADAFGVSKTAFRRIRATHLGAEADDPYALLGLDAAADDEAVKDAYRRLAKEHHPDALRARGVPETLLKIGEGRIAAINDAYERIQRERSG